MARQVIDIGIQGNDGTGDSIRESFRKVNENFTQLFAVFGQGDRIAFTDLDDAPSSYGADQVIVSNNLGDGLVAKGLIGGDGITVDHTAEDQIVIISTGGKVSYDTNPNLGGHLSGGGTYTVGWIADPTDQTAEEFNIQHQIKGTPSEITSDELVLTKGFADRRYIQTSGNSYGGNKIRVRDEPTSIDEYTLPITLWIDGYANIPDHGFNTGLNGIPYVYQADGTSASNLIKGNTYYIRYHDKDNLGIYPTADDAVAGTNRIFADIPATATGNQSLLDAAYDSNLVGNWLSNEALPRKSVVRRQGDEMTGSLMLFDHPGSLAGQGSPNGLDDLQAATKYYVDNSSFASQANLFVATSGDDTQRNTPPGKEGRAFAYAYGSLNAACVKAEELINESKKEPGPYRQRLTFNDGTNYATLNSSTAGSGVTRTLQVYTNGQGVDQSKDVNNRDLREGNIIKGIRSGATAIVKSYNGTTSLYDEYVVELLHKTTDVVYYQSDFANASDRLVQNKELIKQEVIEYVYVNDAPAGFDAAKCIRDIGYIVDALAHDIKYGGNSHTVKAARSYWRGTQSVLPSIDQQNKELDAITYLGYIVNDIINNTIIPTVGVIYKRRSDPGDFPQDTTSGPAGETGSTDLASRLLTVMFEIIENGVDPDPGTLLDFLEDEELEYGQPVPELQITVMVESGVYYEQLPIRVPTNVSIRGDELRRVLIRPAPGTSTSKWANLYFYRDSTFDGLQKSYDVTGGTSSGTTITVDSTVGLEGGMTVYVTGGTGTFQANTKIVTVVSAVEFIVNKEPTTTLSGATIRALDPSGLAPVGGEFGYHYLTDPTGVYGVFGQVPTAGNTVAAGLINAQRTAIQDDVITWINATYPELDYSTDLCHRDVGYIVDAIVADLTDGGVERSLAAGQSYYANASSLVAITTQLTETLAALDYANTLMQDILDAGVGVEANANDYVDSLVNGIKNIIVGDVNPPKENKDMDVFLLNDGTLLRYITVQSHGGFMCVLDPEGQILTKSPYIQTCTSLSGSVNKKSFRGGMYIDGSSGNLPATITTRNSKNELVVGGLFERSPQVPNNFFINGIRYQINEVRNYDRGLGTATLIIDDKTSSSLGIGLKATLSTGTGIVTLTYGTTAGLSAGDTFTKTGGVGAFGVGATILSVDTATQFTMDTDHLTGGAIVFNLQGASLGFPGTISLPYDIVIQTAGNRSMLSNDYTQINDYGYGLVATNNAVTEAVSVFTYYNQISYYALNGGQIRTVAGSSCNGEYGLKAEGRDPNEVPDEILLVDELVQTIKIYKRGSYSSTGVEGDIVIYADHYNYIPTNVSELEIDTSNTKSSIIPDADNLTNIIIDTAGTGYAVNDLLTEDTVTNGAELYTASNPTILRVTEVDGGGAGPGAVTGVEVIDVGAYKKNPVGGYPTVTGAFDTVTDGLGSGCKIQGTFLGSIDRYQVNSVEKTTVVGSGVGPGGVPTTPYVVRLNLASSSGSSALKAPIEDGQIVNIRALRNLRFTGVDDTSPARASTAIQFENEESFTTYNSIGYDVNYGTGGSLPPTQAIITLDKGYDYALLTVFAEYIGDVDPGNPLKTLGATVGDTRIAIRLITSQSVIDRLNAGVLEFTWAGRRHTIDSYTATTNYGYLEISDTPYGSGTIVNNPTAGILAAFPVVKDITVRGGLPAGYPANISKNISTCRATGHDFLDIGTGGYNTTNYPNNVFGGPIQTPSQAREVIEVAPGRVFYVSTDQNGIFRVGKYFSVDQGTGTVSFAASIAITDLDGLGFKKGAVVKEFSYDDTMADNDVHTVPTEFAVRGYVDRRLGKTHDGINLSSGDMIGPGYYALDGSMSLTGDLDVGGYRVIDVHPNTSSPYDASNIDYVDTQVASKDSFYKLKDVLGKDSYSAGDVVAYSGAGQSLISASIGGDMESTFIIGSVTATLVGQYDTGTGITSPGLSGSGDIDGIVVDDITGFFVPTGSLLGYLQINNEIFTYTSITVIANRFDGIARAKGASSAAAHTAGASVINLNGASIDLQIKPEVIVNADVSTTAAIEQSKLDMNAATTRANATGIAQADLGLAAFDDDNFEATDGFIAIKEGGIALTEIETIGAGTILANLTGSTDHPSAVGTSTLVSNGLDTLFASTITNSGSAMIRRDNSLSVGASSFITISGVAVGAAVTKLNVPTVAVSGSGYGALVNVSKTGSGGGYAGVTTIIVTFGGTEYAIGDILKVKGSYLDGVDGINDLSFTISNNIANIDETSYYDTVQISKLATANSIVQSDSTRNIGSAANTFNAMYATTFYGNLTGSASNVDLTATNTSTNTHYLSFVASATGSEIVRTDTGLTYVPNSGTLTSTIFKGDLDGNAGTASVATAVTLDPTDATNATHYITFVQASSGDEHIRTDTNLTYNPSTNFLTATKFIGNLQGTADTATTAGKATNLAGTTQYSIPYQSASQSTSYIPVGDAGQVLISGGSGAAPTWSDAIGNYRIADDGSSYDISSISRLTNIATITTVASHGYSPGDIISVSCPTNSTFNANFVTLLSGTTGTTIKYTSTGADVGATAATGSVSASTNTSRIVKIGTAGPDLGGLESSTQGLDPYTIAARDSLGNLRANFFEGTAARALFADLAEWYRSDKEYEAGTVLVFGGDAEVTTTNLFGDVKLAGVVSTRPAFEMNQGLEGTRACVALQGRVPCKVVGRVKKGDMLTTSAIPGHAAKALDPKIGTIIGKALQDKDTSEAGVIEVAVGRV